RLDIPKKKKKSQDSDSKDETEPVNKNTTFNFDLCGSAKLRKTISAHTDTVRSIDYSTFDDCDFLCSGSSDKTICVWDMGTSKQLSNINEYSHVIFCVKFSPYHYYYHNRSIICSASYDKTIRFVDFKSNKECKYLTDTLELGRYLCSGSNDESIRLWDVGTSTLLHVFNGHEDGILCVDFSPLQTNGNHKSAAVIGGNGYSICSGSWDGNIRLWDIETAKELSVFKGHEGGINTIKYLPYATGINGGGGSMLCSGSGDKTVRLWDIRSENTTQVFIGHTESVTCVDNSPFVNATIDQFGIGNANIMCSGSWDNTIRFWDIRITKQLHEIKGNDNDDGISCLKFSPFHKKREDTFLLCYGARRGSIRLWE
ncbi:WD-40 repeat protein, partial [Reticulomyxa filosa]